MDKKKLKSVGELITAQNIQKKIYYVRGQRVMLDYDLAEIYGYETRYFNRQVKNNIDKFDGEDFMFRLTMEESQNLMCKKFTSSWGGSRHLPYAFTEQGIYMLMTVLRGELAVKQSRALIRMFKSMKDFIMESQERTNYRSNLQLALKVAENTGDIEKVKSELSCF